MVALLLLLYAPTTARHSWLIEWARLTRDLSCDWLTTKKSVADMSEEIDLLIIADLSADISSRGYIGRHVGVCEQGLRRQLEDSTQVFARCSTSEMSWSCYTKNFLRVSNLETLLLLLKMQTFIIVYSVFYISLIALILPSFYLFFYHIY